MKITKQQEEELRVKLNKKYDEVERLDAQIDMLILKRNHLISEIESGAAIIMKYGSG